MSEESDNAGGTVPQSPQQARRPVNCPPPAHQPSFPTASAQQDHMFHQQSGVFVQHGGLPPQVVTYQYPPQQPQSPENPPPYNQPQFNAGTTYANYPQPTAVNPNFTSNSPVFHHQQGFPPQQPGFIPMQPVQTAYIQPIQPVRQQTEPHPDEKKPIEVNVNVVNQAQATATTSTTVVGEPRCSAGCLFGTCLACLCCTVM